MANSVETTLLEQLRLIQAQKAAFDSEAKKIVDRCLAEHAGVATETGTETGVEVGGTGDTSSTGGAVNADSEDVDMEDAYGEPEAATSAQPHAAVTAVAATAATAATVATAASAATSTSQPPAAPQTEPPTIQPAATTSGDADRFPCGPCYNDLTLLIHNTYAAAAPAAATPAANNHYWFAGKKQHDHDAFMAELDRRLDAVRQLRMPLEHVDAWIAAQKQAWLRDQLLPSSSAALQAMGDVVARDASASAADKTEWQALLADPTADVGRLVSAVAERVVGSGDDKERVLSEAQATVQKLLQLNSNNNSGGSEAGVIYRDTLFPHGVPDLPAARAIEQKLLSGEIGLDQGVREVMRAFGGPDDDNDNSNNNNNNNNNDSSSNSSRAAKMVKHRKRLAELRRAKAAHEALKLKKLKQTDVPYFLRDEAACAACSKACDPQKSPFCNICFLEVDYCLRENQTVWCSTACMKSDYSKHIADNHPCKAGDRCVRAMPESDTARAEPRFCFCFCRECVLSFSKSTVYCTDRCPGRDFQSHRETVHLPNRTMRDDTHDDHGDLAYSSPTKKSYTAADISKHIMTMEEAFLSCQKKHPDWEMTTTKVLMTL